MFDINKNFTSVVVVLASVLFFSFLALPTYSIGSQGIIIGGPNLYVTTFGAVYDYGPIPANGWLVVTFVLAILAIITLPIADYLDNQNPEAKHGNKIRMFSALFFLVSGVLYFFTLFFIEAADTDVTLGTGPLAVGITSILFSLLVTARIKKLI